MNTRRRHLVILTLVISAAIAGTSGVLYARSQSYGTIVATGLHQIGKAVSVYGNECRLAQWPYADGRVLANKKYLKPSVSLTRLREYERRVQIMGKVCTGLWFTLLAAVAICLYRVPPWPGRRWRIVRKLVLWSGIPALCLGLSTALIGLLREGDARTPLVAGWLMKAFQGPASYDFLNDYAFVEGVRLSAHPPEILAYERPDLRPEGQKIAVGWSDGHVSSMSRVALAEILEKEETARIGRGTPTSSAPTRP